MNFNQLFRKIVEHEPLTINEQYLISVAFIELQQQWYLSPTSREQMIKQYGTMFSDLMKEKETE